VRFQTALNRPARWRLRDMPIPMAPRPTKPTRMLSFRSSNGRIGQVRNYTLSGAALSLA